MISIVSFSAENSDKWRIIEVVNKYLYTVKILNLSLVGKEIANYLNVTNNMLANKGNSFLEAKNRRFLSEIKIVFLHYYRHISSNVSLAGIDGLDRFFLKNFQAFLNNTMSNALVSPQSYFLFSGLSIGITKLE